MYFFLEDTLSSIQNVAVNDLRNASRSCFSSKKNSGYYLQLVHARVSTGRKLDYSRVVKQSLTHVRAKDRYRGRDRGETEGSPRNPRISLRNL